MSTIPLFCLLREGLITHNDPTQEGTDFNLSITLEFGNIRKGNIREWNINLIFTLRYNAELRYYQRPKFESCGYCCDEILWKGEFHFQTQIDHWQNQENPCNHLLIFLYQRKLAVAFFQKPGMAMYVFVRVCKRWWCWGWESTFIIGVLSTLHLDEWC